MGSNGKLENTDMEKAICHRSESAYLRQAGAARYIGISESTLARLRMRCNRHAGPRYSKVAGCIIYRKSDLDHWLKANLVGEAGNIP